MSRETANAYEHWLVTLLKRAVAMTIILTVLGYLTICFSISIDEISAGTYNRIFLAVMVVAKSALKVITLPFSSNIDFFMFIASMSGTYFAITLIIGLIRVGSAKILKSVPPKELMLEMSNVVINVGIGVFTLSTIAVVMMCQFDHELNHLYFEHVMRAKNVKMMFLGGTGALALICLIFPLSFKRNQEVQES